MLRDGDRRGRQLCFERLNICTPRPPALPQAPDLVPNAQPMVLPFATQHLCIAQFIVTRCVETVPRSWFEGKSARDVPWVGAGEILVLYLYYSSILNSHQVANALRRTKRGVLL